MGRSATPPGLERTTHGGCLTAPGLSALGRRSHLRPWGVSRDWPQQYRRGVSGGSFPAWSQTEQVRVLVPVFAVGTAIIAAVTDSSSGADLILCGLAAAPFPVWAYVPGVPLPAMSLAVIVPAVVAQRSGQLEPLLFEVSLLAFVIGRSASWPTESVALGVLALLAPVVASVVQDPSEISTGIWILGIAFPWVFGRAAGRQAQLVAQLEATRTELAQQALHVERRRTAGGAADGTGGDPQRTLEHPAHRARPERALLPLRCASEDRQAHGVDTRVSRRGEPGRAHDVAGGGDVAQRQGRGRRAWVAPPRAASCALKASPGASAFSKMVGLELIADDRVVGDHVSERARLD
jgi:hypothetical protein